MPVIPETLAAGLLQDLVAIPSLSGHEEKASRWLVDRMAHLGFARAYVDAAGNAVGEMGDPDASDVIVLLGHIDTVPGRIPVRQVTTPEGTCLYGRGTVDAKGPLMNFVLSAARMQDSLPPNTRLLVAGAVEEEAATSRGARHIRDRFDGSTNPVPRYCIIGEPSGAGAIARGYKGRILIRLEASQPMAHTAGPERAIAEWIADYWQWLRSSLALANLGQARLFDQVSPSLREFSTSLRDATHNHARCLIGIRLPPAFNLHAFIQQNLQWIADSTGAGISAEIRIGPEQPQAFPFQGPGMAGTIHFSGFEPAWLTPRRNHLCRSLQGAIRRETGRRPRFTVKTGTSDMNVVGPAWQCPVVAYGPGDSLLDHTPDEHILLSEFHAGTRILTHALRSLMASL